MKKNNVIGFLCQNGWLSKLPETLRNAIVPYLKITTRKKDEPVVDASRAPGGIIGIAEGSMTLEFLASIRSPQNCFFLHEGTWSGDGTLDNYDLRIFNYTANCQSTFAILERSSFHEIAARNPEIWRFLHGLSLENSARAIRMADALMERNSKKRLALVLLELSGCHDFYGSRPAVIRSDQGKLAAMANLARSSFSPLLRELQSEGLVASEPKSIRVISPNGLRKIIAD